MSVSTGAKEASDKTQRLVLMLEKDFVNIGIDFMLLRRLTPIL